MAAIDPLAPVLPRGAAKTKTLRLTFLVASLALSYWILAAWKTSRSSEGPPSTMSVADEMDARLQQTAKTALGDREGTIIVIDPQTGRVRSVVNPELAFQNAYPPGSTIKPFTALAGVRQGLIDRNSRTLCRERYHHDDFAVVCSHPRELAPLNPTEAIAYSCNYYFARLGEQLSEVAFASTLSDFGFGQKTGINSEHESPGKLLKGEWQPQNAIGEGAYLQVTPVQLLTAYAALLNGGLLLTPSAMSADNFTPHLRSSLQIGSEERSIIIEGMRGAIRYGTAERGGLNSLPLYVVGKTGTSAPIRGFRSQGWFVGFAAPLGGQFEPSNVGLGIVVYLKHAHGAEAAELSRSIFEEYARGTQQDVETRERNEKETARSSSSHAMLPASPRLRGSVSASRDSEFAVTVHQVRENITRTLSLEDYVLGVLSAEGSIEDEPEALKALAITARTFALKNIRRHTNQGYDFCSTTHCQRFVVTEGFNLANSRTPFVTAVRDTAGLVLQDDQGQIAESYFGASCGGMTANLETLWGVHAPPYLRGVRDEYCTTAPHHDWTDVISSDELAQALRSDPRTDVGGTIHRLVVTRRDQTGRAESITIEGERLRTINGWEFKLIVGRVLGWNRLKSSRFSIVRSGSDFVFHGGGFGHGLGLCQEGSHVMAQRGFGYRQILGKYFPGTTVRCLGPTCFSLSLTLGEVFVARKNDKLKHFGHQNPGPQGPSFNWQSHSDLLWEAGIDTSPLPNSTSVVLNPKLDVSAPRRFSTSPRRSLSSEHFRVNYPQTADAKDVTALLGILETNRTSLLQRLPAVGLAMEFPYLKIFINETTGDFVGRTGQPWWAAAATRDRQIELQPLALLQRRGILETTIRHELVHIMIDKLGSGRTPRWLAEGMALSLAGEGPMIQRYQRAYKMSLGELEEKLVSANTIEEMRTAYAEAYAAVQHLLKTEGEARVWQLVAQGKN